MVRVRMLPEDKKTYVFDRYQGRDKSRSKAGLSLHLRKPRPYLLDDPSMSKEKRHPLQKA